MSEEPWRPFGHETEPDIAAYDALHDGVPEWMGTPLWQWIRSRLVVSRRSENGYPVQMLDSVFVEAMAQVLKIPLPDIRQEWVDYSAGQSQIKRGLDALRNKGDALQIADYILANGNGSKNQEFDQILGRSKSLYEVGQRSGRPGLVRRVEVAVKDNADSIIRRTGQAGAKLSRAWELLYGINQNPTEAYRNAILAVENVAIPLVSPKNNRATLGTVINQIESQGDWQLPMQRTHQAAPTSDTLLSMMRVLWHGQHDRHGGQDNAHGEVNIDEAKVAVSLAVVLVQWFADGMISRNNSLSSRADTGTTK